MTLSLSYPSKPLGAVWFALMLTLSSLPMTAALTSSTASTLAWKRLADLPEPVGLKGLYGGVSHGRLLLAGGSNFPVPAPAGGAKTYHATIFSRALDASDDTGWTIESTRLPRPLAEGGSAVTPAGIVLVGGRNAQGLSAATRLMRWDDTSRRVRLENLPDLPAPRASCAVVWSDGCIYVAGGEGLTETDPDFLRMDLRRWQQAPDSATWERLPDCPGPRRFGATLMRVELADGTQLILAGGRRLTSAPVAESDYRRDAWRYDPAQGDWQRRADLPRPMLLGNAVALGPASFLIGGGSDGHDLTRMAELGERCRLPDDIVRYDADPDRWTIIGKLPVGVAAAASVLAGDQWIVAGGEYSPGLRTATVSRLPLNILR